MAYTKADLKHDLVAMGLTGNETILIHSSMKSIGPVEGGADTVLDAWMEFFAEGLLLLPTHTWQSIDQDHPVFDVRRSPCCVGILPVELELPARRCIEPDQQAGNGTLAATGFANQRQRLPALDVERHAIDSAQ